MNKIEQKHLEILKGNLSCDFYHRVNNKEHAALKCAEITKEYSMKFDVWKHENRIHYLKELRQYVKYSIDGDMVMNFDYLWDLFLNDLNEKG